MTAVPNKTSTHTPTDNDEKRNVIILAQIESSPYRDPDLNDCRVYDRIRPVFVSYFFAGESASEVRPWKMAV